MLSWMSVPRHAFSTDFLRFAGNPGEASTRPFRDTKLSEDKRARVPAFDSNNPRSVRTKSSRHYFLIPSKTFPTSPRYTHGHTYQATTRTFPHRQTSLKPGTRWGSNF